MSLKSLPRLSASEVPIMQAVWDAGPITVREVVDAVNAHRQPTVARNTILKQMQRLEEKGWIRRDSRKRPAAYVATASQEAAAKMMTKSLRDGLFAGSPLALVQCVIDASDLTPKQLADLKQLVADAESNQGGSS